MNALAVGQAASLAGANTIDGLRFDLADPRAHRDEAIRQATAHALHDARTLAAAAGVALSRVLSIDLDRSATPVGASYRPMAAEAARAAPPVTPGDVTVRASVTVVYEIAGKQ